MEPLYKKQISVEKRVWESKTNLLYFFNIGSSSINSNILKRISSWIAL
ncbi:MAG: hypothetical protein RSE41_06950 [Clostridia bacterium]